MEREMRRGEERRGEGRKGEERKKEGRGEEGETEILVVKVGIKLNSIDPSLHGHTYAYSCISWADYKEVIMYGIASRIMCNVCL